MFQLGAIISMTIVILVIMTETTADILAVGEIVGTDVSPRRVGDGLRADMLATSLAPVFNSFPASAFAQNVGVVAITGIKSRWVVTAGGSVLVVLGWPAIGAHGRPGRHGRTGRGGRAPSKWHRARRRDRRPRTTRSARSRLPGPEEGVT